jgi:hypothetical protein
MQKKPQQVVLSAEISLDHVDGTIAHNTRSIDDYTVLNILRHTKKLI